jgi:hypothetical protein
MEIAKTIIEQIKYADKWALMAWFHFIALPESGISRWIAISMF